MNKNVLVIFALCVLPQVAWSVGEHCNALLDLGLYNVSQSSSATDAETIALSSFCAYDYSKNDLSQSQRLSVEGSYGFFSAGASGSVSRDEVIETQRSVCTSGFGSSIYRNRASVFSRNVYQGSLTAWNKCQELAGNGLHFEIQPSSTLQGVTVVLTAPTGLSARFFGVTQFGAGRSDCITSVNGSLVEVGPSTPIRMTAAKKVTISCARQLEAIDDDLVADAQDLVFHTSADTLTVPLAPIGHLSRVTADALKAEILSAQTEWVDLKTPEGWENYDVKCRVNDGWIEFRGISFHPPIVGWPAAGGKLYILPELCTPRSDRFIPMSCHTEPGKGFIRNIVCNNDFYPDGSMSIHTDVPVVQQRFEGVRIWKGD